MIDKFTLYYTSIFTNTQKTLHFTGRKTIPGEGGRGETQRRSDNRKADDTECVRNWPKSPLI